ncbi:MAG: hypothetical protein LBC30_04025 [Puniceicoccales bacterium]|nr:hypothetical protein [Puniceicoccales bacterium]
METLRESLQKLEDLRNASGRRYGLVSCDESHDGGVDGWTKESAKEGVSLPKKRRNRWVF